MIIERSLKQLYKHLIDSDYMGFDPYDGVHTKNKFIRKLKTLRVLSTYVNKFSPINFRKILGIQKTQQNQALAFIGRAFLAYSHNKSDEIKNIANILVKQSLITKNGFHSWDPHGFPIQMLRNYTPEGTTDIIGNEAIGRFFLKSYELQPEPLHREICISVRDLLLQKLAVKHENIHHFRYKPITSNQNWCYNASAIGAAFVEAISEHFNLVYDKGFTSQCLKDIIEKQKPEGQWFYSLNLETGYEKPQVDFHQGFVLDAILEHMQLHGFEEPFLSSYKKGLEFFHQKQFLPNGQGIYRYPRKWPVNIHNQAQGIITFTRAAEAGLGEKYHQFARTIAEWTIKNMQDKDGHFYFLKYPLFTNKIPYIRWSDAAMAYALSVLLAYEQKIH